LVGVRPKIVCRQGFIWHQKLPELGEGLANLDG